MKVLRTTFWGLWVGGVLFSAQAAVKINEVQPSNQSTLQDTYGGYSDWIELYNDGSASVDLTGWYLSDNPSLPGKWTFPATSIAAGGYKIIFASGLASSGSELHASFKISADGDQVLLTRPNGTLEDSVHHGVVPAGSTFQRYPDGASSKFLSANPSPNATNRASTATSQALPPVFSQNGGFYQITQATTGLDVRPLLHESSANNAYAGNNSSVEPGTGTEFYVASGGYTHVRYNLASTDEYAGYEMFINGSSTLAATQTLTLYATIPNGQQFDVGFQQTDLNGRSRYRYIVTGNGNENAAYNIPLSDPTGVLNLAALESIKFRAVTAGLLDVKIYDLHFFADENSGGPISVSLSAQNGDEIRYTTNGAEPTQSSTLYTAPINITRTTFLRARAFNDNKLPSPVVSNSYFVDHSYGFPIVSIQMDDADLNGYNTGIYVKGPNAEGELPYEGANFWQDWEKSINFEFFEANGQQVVNQPAGTKIFGGWSRANDRKSLAIYSRKSYGKEGIDYAFFANRPFQSYKNLVLRSGGNDWDQGFIRDGVMTGLVEGADLEVQAWRPCIVLINGENYGMFFIREKINEDYLANHYNLDPDFVDILEKRGEVSEGSADHYDAMIDYVELNSLANQTHYDYIKTQMEVDNYAAYYASEIYFANTDWPGNNIKYWRFQGENTRWRWFLYDTDFGFNLWGGVKDNSASSDNIAWALNDREYQDWEESKANSPRSTFLFRMMMQNQEFENLFVVTMADFLNTYFVADRVKDHIDSLRALVTPGLNYQWSSDFSGGANEWTFADNISSMRRFAEDRPANVFSQLRSHFNLSSTTLDIETIGTGKVKLTSHAFVEGSFSGTYFLNVPVTLTAVPRDGHPFTGWSGAATGSNLSITLPMSAATSVTATFGNDPSYVAPDPEVPVFNPPVVLNIVQDNELNLRLEESGPYTLKAYNSRGTLILEHSGNGIAGSNAVMLNANLPKGIIFMRIQANGKNFSNKILVIR
jgi:hypothetical protein